MALNDRSKVVDVTIESEMKTSYIDYSMSVIVSRALPDVRDGLKPSQRRILVAMNDLNLAPGRGYRKCAKIAGDTSGNYHPHGEQVVYPTLVRLAQNWVMRYPLVDGQGNFGCFTGDTRIRMLDGTDKSFAELAELGPDAIFSVYSVDSQGEIVVGRGRNARITRRNAPLVEVELDHGEKIRCTPDHRFLLRDNTYKQARDLLPTDSLMPGYFDTAPVKKGLKDYLRIHQPTMDRWDFVHRLADRFNAENGLTKAMRGPFVRHHKNFDRWDNRPENIERMGFLEHLHLHAKQLGELWNDQGFRTAQRDGVKKYYAEHEEARESRRHRMVRQNRDPQFRLENGKRVSRSLKARIEADPELKKVVSDRMRTLWTDSDYRARMSAALRGIEKRPLSPEQKAQVARIIGEKSTAMWADSAKRDEIVQAIVRALSAPEVRAKISANTRALWASPEYRAKFGEAHFSRMAKTLWSLPETRGKHRVKIENQWSQDAFREAQRRAVRASNARRLAGHPEMMKELASRAATSLRVSWRDPDHRRQVMRTRIARYVSSLIHTSENPITPVEYQSGRKGKNWVPKIETALEYFDSFEELIQAGRTYNHRVVSVTPLMDTADVYDITVDKHHNFLLSCGVFAHNSIDGDAPAAMRYTEARLTPLAAEMLADLEKETVDYRPNYDETREEPVVLPGVVPNLLINGCSGIAVGMATEVPPHNLTEVCDAIVHVIEHPDATAADLHKIIRGPDFPTGGIIHGLQGIRDCYLNGRGLIKMRARVQVEEGKAGRMSLVATEIPFQVNKSALLEKIADLVKEGRVQGISDLRDESDREGMRIVIELKKDANPKVVLNQLFVHSPLQSTFGAIMLALVDKRPQILNLRQLVDQYILHRQEVIRRRTQFDLTEAEKRAHILEGLKIALDHLDAVIALIRKAKDVETARTGLMSEFKLTEIQANAILEMRLARLTGLERSKIEQEYLEVIQLIEKLRSILANPKKILAIVHEEVTRLKEKYGDERRTEIVHEEGDINYEDTIEQKDMVITISHAGYVKRQEISSYRSQRRGGKGVIGARTKEEDYIEHLFIAGTHSYLLFLTDKGRCYWLKVHEVEQAGRMARGRPLVNHLEGLSREERVQAVVVVKEFDDKHFLVCATKKGLIKKTVLSAYGNPRRGGINAVLLEEGDALFEAILTDGTHDIILAKKKGLAIRFPENEVRAMGRTAYGVKAVTLDDAEDEVVSMVGVRRLATLLTVTEHGYGKRSEISEYRVSHRGGKGIITIKTTDRNGQVVAVKEVVDGDELMIITRQGQLIRMPVKGISVIGRNTQGVRLVNLAAAGEGELLPDTVAGVTRVVNDEDQADNANGDVPLAPPGEPVDEATGADGEAEE